MGESGARIDFEEVTKRLACSEADRSVVAYERGTMTVKMYAPRGSDSQTPHKRDELYMVVKGSGDFVYGSTRVRFRPYDVLFAAAGVVHRFENFTDDLMVWVIFYGPEGGERA